MHVCPTAPLQQGDLVSWDLEGLKPGSIPAPPSKDSGELDVRAGRARGCFFFFFVTFNYGRKPAPTRRTGGSHVGREVCWEGPRSLMSSAWKASGSKEGRAGKGRD